MKLTITTPKGIMPKISADLIGFSQAQVAENCKLYNGQLQPWDNYLLTQLCNSRGIIQTIFLYEDIYWFEFEADVDIVPAPTSGDTESKIYYTGDGIPKKTNLDEATTGSGAMPISFYPMAVPTPLKALTNAETGTMNYSGTNTGGEITGTNTGIAATYTGTVTGNINIYKFTDSSATYKDWDFQSTIVNASIKNDTRGTTGAVTKSLDNYIECSGAGFTPGNAYTITPDATYIILEDSTKTWEYHDLYNAVIENTTDGSSGTVTENGTTRLRCTLTGGSDNSWDIGDSYKITYSSADTLEDSTKSWAVNALVGAIINNTTDGSSGVVTANTATTITATLSGGAGNVWDKSDAYTVVLNSTFTGTHTGSYDASTLTDSTKSWTANILVGATVTNVTDGSSGTVTANGISTITATLSGGSENKWDTGDNYYITPDLSTQRYTNYRWTVVSTWGEESYPAPPSDNILTSDGYPMSLSDITMIWIASNPYAVNDIIFSTASEGGTYMYICVQAGTSGSSEPTWGTTIDGDTIDGAVIWRCFKNNLEYKRIYRLVSGDSSAPYQYVDEIDIDKTTYTDTILDADLGELCPSLSSSSGGQADEDWDPPPQDLKGITYMGNGIIVGFVGKEIYACVPYRPWAWPAAYVISMPDDITCISSVGAGSTAIVTTSGAPYLLSGTTGASLSLTRLPEIKTNLAKRGTINTSILSGENYYSGVVYPSTDGLRFVNSEGTSMLLTQNLLSVDEWAECHPDTMHGRLHDNKYFGFWQTDDDEGGIVFDLMTGDLTTLDFYCTATYVDPATDTLYFIRSTNMSVFEQAWTAPDAATTTGKATQFVLTAAGSVAGIVQPDYPRNLVFTITDANASLTAIQITVTGTLATGEESQTEVYTTTTAGSNALNKAFAHIDSITVDSVTGGAAGDTLDIGYGVKFGLNNAIEDSADIFKTNMDNDNVAVSGHTISTTYNTITFATAPNATHNYQAWYVSNNE